MIVSATLLCPAALPSATEGGHEAQDRQTARVASASEPRPAIERFQENVREYMLLRQRLWAMLPTLPDQATPEQIRSHALALQLLVQKARENATRGAIFNPEVADHLRRIVRTAYTTEEAEALREAIMATETADVPVAVNMPYPGDEPRSQVPPKLLLAFPELPPEVKYRFAGRALLLVDRHNNLILDYIEDVFPAAETE